MERRYSRPTGIESMLEGDWDSHTRPPSPLEIVSVHATRPGSNVEPSFARPTWRPSTLEGVSVGTASRPSTLANSSAARAMKPSASEVVTARDTRNSSNVRSKNLLPERLPAGFGDPAYIVCEICLLDSLWKPPGPRINQAVLDTCAYFVFGVPFIMMRVSRPL